MSVLLPILSTLGTIGMSLLTSLMTETFLKKAILIGLEKLAKKTETEADDQLLEAVKEAWGKK